MKPIPAANAQASRTLRPAAKAALLIAAVCAGLLIAGYLVATRVNINPMHAPGDQLDEFKGVGVYYNGAINHVAGRLTTSDGYNLGLRYQCVEFVKRYYYERFGHEMPNSMGNAKEFFSARVPHGALNTERMLVQYRNGAGTTPQEDDLIVFAPWAFNRYGHVAIVSAVGADFIEVVQQNPGPFGTTRERYALESQGRIAHSRALGWLRRPDAKKAP